MWHRQSSSCPLSTKHKNLFDTQTESVSQVWKHIFLKQATRLRPAVTAANLKTVKAVSNLSLP